VLVSNQNHFRATQLEEKVEDVVSFGLVLNSLLRVLPDEEGKGVPVKLMRHLLFIPNFEARVSISQHDLHKGQFLMIHDQCMMKGSVVVRVSLENEVTFLID
jgi:hypothetical protein